MKTTVYPIPDDDWRPMRDAPFNQVVQWRHKRTGETQVGMKLGAVNRYFTDVHAISLLDPPRGWNDERSYDGWKPFRGVITIEV